MPVNRTRHVVVPTRPRLRAVEVVLINGNPNMAEIRVVAALTAASGLWAAVRMYETHAGVRMMRPTNYPTPHSPGHE